ncbi:DUF2218 domain-containing protein [Pseudomonas mangiferae]|uniref:DUF2218 domain-containing protein n=1 Tax=Pseudomonas mangiferae TaxID=2593654 RepID=A0A553H2Q5_9PSED|nr:DUF2218 domain-containing protein [Pseudomonas mangiferae]TRX76033.1 DUF2218 domain-containing protein [Pseudomonas mangiferae]
MSIRASAKVLTDTPGRYIGRLCKHFAHKIPVRYDERQGRIEFAFGVGTLEAQEDGLVLRAEAAREEDLDRLKEVLASHFERFAWQEALTLNWQAA